MEHLALKKCGEAGYVNKQGDPCGNWPVKGTVTCKFHAGTSLTKTRAKGRLRLSAAAFSLDDLPSSLDATAEAIRLVLVTKRLHEELRGHRGARDADGHSRRDRAASGTGTLAVTRVDGTRV
jgi:hypothetical protein